MSDKPTQIDLANRITLRKNEAAEALGISERTLVDLTKRNEVPHIKLAGAVLYPVQALIQWANQAASDRLDQLAEEQFEAGDYNDG